MTRAVLMDTGPLAAYYLLRHPHHAWAVQQFQALPGPMLTCEPVLTEVCHFLLRSGVAATELLSKVVDQSIRVDFRIAEEANRVRALMHQYRDRPMSFADACLVRMAETTGLPICTLDSDFRVYRRRGRGPLTVICP